MNRSIRKPLTITLLLALLLPLCPTLANDSIRILFYNSENLFDPTADSINPDQEYTPQGSKRWGWKRLKTKQQNLARAISLCGQGAAPDIVGLCEVESHRALAGLYRGTVLNATNYNALHREGPDPRGIEVALLYRPERLRLLWREWVTPPDTIWRSRETLIAAFQLPNRDTLIIAQCHWPSLFSGYANTQPKRLRAARLLKSIFDTSCLNRPRTHFLAMGDFNLPPTDTLILSISTPSIDSALAKRLLLAPLHPQGSHPVKEGSHRFNGKWSLIDQLFISPSLARRSNPGWYLAEAGVCNVPLLLEPDPTFGGYRPRRSFRGPRFDPKGYSDHLPMRVLLVLSD